MQRTAQSCRSDVHGLQVHATWVQRTDQGAPHLYVSGEHVGRFFSSVWGCQDGCCFGYRAEKLNTASSSIFVVAIVSRKVNYSACNFLVFGFSRVFLYQSSSFVGFRRSVFFWISVRSERTDFFKLLSRLGWGICVVFSGLQDRLRGWAGPVRLSWRSRFKPQIFGFTTGLMATACHSGSSW